MRPSYDKRACISASNLILHQVLDFHKKGFVESIYNPIQNHFHYMMLFLFLYAKIKLFAFIKSLNTKRIVVLSDRKIRKFANETLLKK